MIIFARLYKQRRLVPHGMKEKEIKFLIRSPIAIRFWCVLPSAGLSSRREFQYGWPQKGNSFFFFAKRLKLADSLLFSFSFHSVYILLSILDSGLAARSTAIKFYYATIYIIFDSEYFCFAAAHMEAMRMECSPDCSQRRCIYYILIIGRVENVFTKWWI